MNKKWFAVVLVVAIILIVDVGGTYYFEDHAIIKSERAAVTNLVEDFASKIKNVSLSSPEDVLISQMKEAYLPFITKSLMGELERNPSEIVGKITCVTSRDGKLNKAGEIPIDLVVKRISKKGGYLIDKLCQWECVSVSDSEQITPKYISYSYLKTKEIKSAFTAIGAAFEEGAL